MNKFTTSNKFRSKEIEMANTISSWGFEIEELNDGVNVFYHDRYYASDFRMKTEGNQWLNVSFKDVSNNKAQCKAFALRNLVYKELSNNGYWIEDGQIRVNDRFKQSQINLFYKIARLFTADNKSVTLSNYFKHSTALWTMTKYGSKEIQQELFQPDAYVVKTKEGYRAYKNFDSLYNSIIVYRKGSNNASHDIDLEYINKEGEKTGLMLQFNIKEELLLEQPYQELEELFI